MSMFRIALANIEFPASPAASVQLVRRAIADASAAGARLVCFPECSVPGYRGAGKRLAAAEAHLTVVLGTERVLDKSLLISTLVINPDGTRAGFQDADIDLALATGLLAHRCKSL